jgi:hypothetical protein
MKNEINNEYFREVNENDFISFLVKRNLISDLDDALGVAEEYFILIKDSHNLPSSEEEVTNYRTYKFTKRAFTLPVHQVINKIEYQLGIYSKKDLQDIYILKDDDNWYLVKIYWYATRNDYNNDNIYKQQFFICDQIEGLEKLFSDLFKDDQKNLNEKTNWKNILLALGLTFAASRETSKFLNFKEVINTVTSTNSKPNNTESKLIEEIRQDVISEIKDSKIFKKTDKYFIIDSLKKVEFYLVDSIIPFKKQAEACFISISELKKKYKFLISKIPHNDNFIILNRKSLENESYRNTIVHEINHYFDKLLGDEINYSVENKISSFTDSNLENDVYMRFKISTFLLLEDFDDQKKKNFSREESASIARMKETILQGILKDYRENLSYYKSSQEIFARFRALKDDMVQSKVIPNVDTPLTIENLATYLGKSSTEKKLENLYLILTIDLTKLDELNKLL